MTIPAGVLFFLPTDQVPKSSDTHIFPYHTYMHVSLYVHIHDMLLFAPDWRCIFAMQRRLAHVSLHTDLLIAWALVMTSVSADRSIVWTDLQMSKAKCTMTGAHESSLHSICRLSEFLVCTGDDNGVLKVRKTSTSRFDPSCRGGHFSQCVNFSFFIFDMG